MMNNNQQLEGVVTDPKTIQCALGFKGDEGVKMVELHKSPCF